MRVALVGPEIEENLGLRYLAAALVRAGFDCDLLPFNSGPDLPGIVRVVAERSPDVVAISLAFQWRALDCLALAAALRESGYRGHITGGGHFGTFTAADILREFSEVDSLCLHEAEETLPDLVRALQQGVSLEAVSGLALRRADGSVAESLRRPPDLERVAWPDRRGELSSCLGHRVAAMVGSRGCYGRCSFCCIAAWHERTLPGKRYRLRPVEDVADEMTWLRRECGADIFVFHDDNFFLPEPRASRRRIEELADALEARGAGRFATVVKARPDDLTPEVLRPLVERLGLARIFLGVESDATQGLRTLARGVERAENHAAMALLQEFGVYTCFNLLCFDPDTGLDDLEANIDFMERWAEVPHNFGRVELYAGTPLLARMSGEGRAHGDWMGHDYALADPSIQRVFDLVRLLFHERNFAPGAIANRLMGTRFDVEVARFFHPDRFRPEWDAQSRELNRRLAHDSAASLRRIIEFVRTGGTAERSFELTAALDARLRATEAELRRLAGGLEKTIQAAIGATCRHARPPGPMFEARTGPGPLPCTERKDHVRKIA